MAGLYQAYRPRTFDEVVGNKEAIRTLESFIKRDRSEVPHAFLFSGPSGCGKTTLARILAKKLGCSDANFVEIDSADFRGIDTIREIRRQMRLAPVGGGSCRVWLIDECHKLTGDAQSALLKALEDTPSHVYFLLATTDPEKLIKTVRNRCTTIIVSSLTEKQLISLMDEICQEEKKKVPEDILKLIAKNALGSARASLVALDQVIDLDKKEMANAINDNMARESKTLELCQAIFNGAQWTSVQGILNGLRDEDPESVRRSVLGYSCSVLLGNSTKKQAFAMDVIDVFWDSLYNTGFPGLVKMCYDICRGGK